MRPASPPLLASLILVGLAAGLRVPATPRQPPVALRRACTPRLCADDAPPQPPASSVEHEQSSPPPPAAAKKGRTRERVKKLGIWSRIRQRVKDRTGPGEEPTPEEVQPLLEGVVDDIDSVLVRRRRRLNVKLGTSLKKFREEVLDEVEQQASEGKERQQRLKSRQASITDSLTGLQQDILAEIDDGLKGVRRGGETLERALGEMRDAWEAEVAEIVSDAKADVDLAVEDLEVAIQQQRDEVREVVPRAHSAVQR